MPTTSWLEQADTLPTLTDHPLHALRTYTCTMLHTAIPSQRLGHRCPAGVQLLFHLCGSLGRVSVLLANWVKQADYTLTTLTAHSLCDTRALTTLTWTLLTALRVRSRCST